MGPALASCSECCGTGYCVQQECWKCQENSPLLNSDRCVDCLNKKCMPQCQPCYKPVNLTATPTSSISSSEEVVSDTGNGTNTTAAAQLLLRGSSNAAAILER